MRSLKNVSLCKNSSLMMRGNAHISQKIGQPYTYIRVMYNLYMFTDHEIRLKHRWNNVSCQNDTSQPLSTLKNVWFWRWELSVEEEHYKPALLWHIWKYPAAKDKQAFTAVAKADRPVKKLYRLRYLFCLHDHPTIPNLLRWSGRKTKASLIIIIKIKMKIIIILLLSSIFPPWY